MQGHAMLQRLRSLLRGGVELDLLIGLVLKGMGALASFGLNLLIARVLGADGIGVFQIALATAALLSVLSVLGLDTVIVRTVSVAWRRQDFAVVRASIVKVLKIVAGWGAIVALVVGALSVPFAETVLGHAGVGRSLLLMIAAVPALALIRAISASIRATGRVLLSQSLDGVSYTGLTAVALGAMLLARGGIGFNAPAATYLAASWLVLAVSLACVAALIRKLPHGTADISLRSGGRISLIYLLGFLVEWSAVVMLAASAGAAEAGIYRVAAQFGLLFLLVRNAFDQMVGAHLAARFAEQDYAGMRAMARRTGLIGAVLSAPVALLIIIAPSFLLGLFGPEFKQGALALMILGAGQFASVAIGPLGTILDMSHREDLGMKIEFAVAATALVLLFVLTPQFGLTGTAAAVTCSIFLRIACLKVVSDRLLARFEQAAAQAELPDA